MAGVLRTQVLRRVFGEGVAGTAGAAVASWGLGKVADGIRRDEELLDVSKLRVGETYTIVTRPAPKKRERKVARRVEQAERKVRAATRQSRAQRRAARRLERVQRQAAKTDPVSVKGVRLQVQEQTLEGRYQRLTTRTPKQLDLIARRDALRAELQAEQATALAKARRKARPPRRRIWPAR